MDGETDHREGTTHDRLNEQPAATLDGIGACLVHRLTRVDVVGDLVSRHGHHPHLGHVHQRADLGRPRHRHPGEDLMNITLEAAKHRPRLFGVSRLAQDVAVVDHGRVPRYRHRGLISHASGLLTGNTLDIDPGRLVGST